MRTAFFVALLGACSCAPSPAAVVPIDRDGARRAIARELDDFHEAAARADEARYFAHFAKDGVFLGTDATERWDVAAFRAYAHPHFERGKAWAFRATRRAIALSADARVAWFDEDLATERLGPARGSGALALVDGAWKLEQYNLTTVVPNDRFAAVRAAIDGPEAPSRSTFEDRYEADIARAVDAATKGDFGGAERTLRELVADGESGEVELRAIGLHDDLMWMRWAEGDLAGAYSELERMRSAHARSRAMGHMSMHMRADEDFARAFLFCEMAAASPPTLRAESLAAAAAARATAEKSGVDLGHRADVNALATLFAVRARDAKGALAIAKGDWTSEDTEPLHLYVLALAFELGGEQGKAAATRARIREAPANQMMKLVVVRRLENDARGKK